MSTKTVRQILLAAFDEIQRSHGIAVTSVRFDLVYAGDAETNSYIASDVEIEGKANGGSVEP